jgi:hypothetical protein
MVRIFSSFFSIRYSKPLCHRHVNNNKTKQVLFLFIVVPFVVSLYVLWVLFQSRQMKSRAYQKRFAKLSQDDLNRLVDHMKKPLNRDPLPPSSVDPSGWRLEGVDGQQVWVHYGDKSKAPREQNVAEKFHLGLPLSEKDAPTLPKPQTAADSAINGARFVARTQVVSNIDIRLLQMILWFDHVHALSLRFRRPVTGRTTMADRCFCCPVLSLHTMSPNVSSSRTRSRR